MALITRMIYPSAKLPNSSKSRQAVFDNIKRTEVSLEEYEKKLCLFQIPETQETFE